MCCSNVAALFLAALAVAAACGPSSRPATTTPEASRGGAGPAGAAGADDPAITPNAADEGPEPDRDGDGLLNDDDQCADDAEDADGFRDDDGCPDPDNDGDGVTDSSDLCPGDPEDADAFQDEDGCPDPDNDGDGVLDGADRCPLQPGRSGGCPG